MRPAFILATILALASAPALAADPDITPYLRQMLDNTMANLATCAAKLDASSKEIAELKAVTKPKTEPVPHAK